ncbi:MAG TPA: ATP-binding protein [Candidatus Krumholzibacteria bacterium]|nr:ATP-binding protein [Candidatus Krumholzibacteria bacterium]
MLFSNPTAQSLRRDPRVRRVGPILRRLPLVIFIVGAAATITLWELIDGNEDRRIQQETRITAQQIRRRLESWIDTRTASVDYLCSRQFTDSTDVRLNFRSAALHFVQLYQGVQALNYIDNQGIIRIVYPESTNAEALGQDLRNDPRPDVGKALQRAETSGSISRTPIIDLFQGGKGFATYEPLRNETGEQLGFVNCVFRVNKLMDSCLPEPELRDRFRFEVLDSFGQRAYIYPLDDNDEVWPLAVALQVRAVDRPWTLRFAPMPAYISKQHSIADELLLLVGLIFITTISLMVSALLQRHEALAASQANYKLLVENQSDMVIKMDPQGRFLYLSPSCFQVFGQSEEELLGTEFSSLIHAEEHDGLSRAFESLKQPPHASHLEQRTMTREGWRWLSWSMSSVLDDEGAVQEIIGVGNDVTKRRELEEQLIQSQKLQAVGQLAGGVAHDFNNILQAMIGYLEFASAEVPEDSAAKKDLDQVQKGIERAIQLTRQLLAFSRRQALDTEILQLNEVCQETIEMLRRMVGESVEIRFQADPHCPAVYADRSQLGQVLMNLCVNARDAMNGRGIITIQTGSLLADQSFLEDHPECHPVLHAYMKIGDNGCGMSPSIQKHVFEPFFTTKEVGAGTGIGLSTVYGIIQQHGGAIDLQSEPGVGTEFTIYLPASDGVVIPRSEDTSEIPVGSGETILVAEDDRLVREVALRVLERSGYKVLSASNGKEALQLFEQHADEIALSILDAVMPELGGRETSARIRALKPDARILFVSGYNPQEVDGKLVLGDNDEILMKPYLAEAFLTRVHEILGHKA